MADHSFVVVLISAFRCRIQIYIVRTARAPSNINNGTQRLRHNPASALSLIIATKKNNNNNNKLPTAQITEC